MSSTSESADWKFLAINLGLEILSVAYDQASSPRRPHFARFGMLLAIAAVFISIGELIYRGKRERVRLRRRLMLCWFYHPPPAQNKPFGTLPDIYGLVAGISQCICSIVQYVYCLRHADSPLKASLLPAIFLICLVGSRLSNNRMNANTSSTEEILLHPISEYNAPTNIPFLDNQEVEVEGNIEQDEQEEEEEEEEEQERFLQEQEQERKRLLEQEQKRQERFQEALLWLQLQEQEQERKRQERFQERKRLRLQERKRLQEQEQEQEQKRQERFQEALLWLQEQEQEQEQLQEQEQEQERFQEALLWLQPRLRLQEQERQLRKREQEGEIKF